MRKNDNFTEKSFFIKLKRTAKGASGSYALNNHVNNFCIFLVYCFYSLYIALSNGEYKPDVW